MNLLSVLAYRRCVHISGSSRISLRMATAVTATNGEVSGIKMDAIVQKSPCDTKSYRYCVLPNGLRCLLISDPEICIGTLTGGIAGYKSS